MYRFANLPIALRLLCGFGLVLLLMIGLGGRSIWGVDQFNRQIARYAEAGEAASHADEIAQRFLALEVAVHDFAAGASPEQLARAETRYAALRAAVAGEAEAASTEPHAGLASVATAAAAYWDGFQELVDLRAARDEVRDMVLRGDGDSLRAAITPLIAEARDAADHSTSEALTRALTAFLLARDYTGRYVELQRPGDLEEAKAKLAEMSKMLGYAERFAQASERREAIAALQPAVATYASGLEAFELLAAEGARLTAEVMEVAAGALATALDETTRQAAERKREAEAVVQAEVAEAKTLAIVLTALAVLLGLLLAMLIGRSIVTPVKAMTAAMHRLSEGDLEVNVPATGRRDEIGRMAAAMQIFKDNAQEAERLRQEAAEREVAQAEEKRRAMNALADSFETSVRGIVESLGRAASEMQTSARALTQTADDSRNQASAVASATQQAAANVQTVAAAAEQMTAAIQAIAKTVEQSNTSAGRAVDQTQETTQAIQELAAKADSIGRVVGLISDIAEQTNLLALNATIESARAGEAGKGFAVVAGEVKNLAGQTGQATEQVGSEVEAVRKATGQAVTVITEIAGIITEISDLANAIAAAIEEQRTATQEISRNVAEASTGTEAVATKIRQVDSAADETGQAAKAVLTAAQDLSRQAELLGQELDRFVGEIRAA